MNFIYREVIEEPPTASAETSSTRSGESSGNGSEGGSESTTSTTTSTTSTEAQSAPEPRLFAGTAGHCVDGVGARVSTRDGAFGTVAYHRLTEDGDAFDDVAFIEIDRAKEHLVNPKMLGFNGPTGYTTAGVARPGDRAHVYGNGLLLGETELTRPRSGTLTYADDDYYGATLPVIFGDSGGPVLHENGQALGIVAHLVVSGDLTTLNGNTVDRALELARMSGLDLEVVPAT